MSENSEGNTEKLEGDIDVLPTRDNDGNQTGNNVMYLTMNWKEEIATIAGPVDFSDSRESWLLRAARKAQITHWHAKALFYGELKDPKWSIGIKVANAAIKARSELEAAKQDAASVSLLHQQLARGIINAAHQNLLGTEATALLDSARLLGGLDMPGDHRINIMKNKGDLK